MIALLTPARPTALIEIAILPDERFFQRDPSDRWSAEMTVKTARVLGFDDRAPIASPFAHPEMEPAPYRFGHASFRLLTRPIDRPTTTSIGISMWANHRPVQELELLVCLDPSGGVDLGRCPLPAFKGDAAAGAVAAALGDGDPDPEAALHLIRLGDRQIVSLFRRGREPLERALKWRLAAGDGFLQSHVSRLTQISKATDPDLGNLGAHLLQDLFEYASDDVAKTRQEFVQFFTDEMRAHPREGRRRTVAFRSGMKDFVPLGLAAVKVGDKPMFLGQQFALDVPLPSAPRAQDGPADCELPWVSVLPPAAGQSAGAEDDTLLDARAQLASRASPLLRQWEKPGDCTFTDMVAFREWANMPDAAPRRAGLFILSHHDIARNMLFFSPAQNDLMSPDDITRPFAPGSLAVLNACGTGKPAAFAFIEALNRRGVDAVIATATEVQADMAGDFAYCLARQIESRKKAVPLGQAFDDALDCLAGMDRKDGGKYGARAYTYALLGDRSLPICRPPLHRPSCKE